MIFPRLYAIADAEVLDRRGVSAGAMGAELHAAGVKVVQYRDKVGAPQEVLARAAQLREALPGCLLVMNDRVDLALLAGFRGAHLGQGDLSPGDARLACGSSSLAIGVSTHVAEEVRQADADGADYLAIGPVFATGTKADAAAVVGLAGVRMARALTRKPLVAIGGITRENCRSVMEAGADAVAVISGLFAPGETVAEVARDFMRILG